MNLRDFFNEVATTYDYSAPMSHPTQLLLRRADEPLQEHIPAGFLLIGSGGHGQPTFTPWVGFFDPDETESPQEGIYVVYLFSSDLSRLTLTLNQGEERLRHAYGDKEARNRLAQDAAAIRAELPHRALTAFETQIDLGPSEGARQKAYKAANIVATRYDTSNFPREEQLRNDLSTFLDLYGQAINAKQHLLLASPGSLAAPGATQTTVAPNADPLRDFKPKDDSDYVAHLSGKRLVKSRRHERLVRQYGEWAAEHGFTPITSEHPKDLVLRVEGAEYLAEAKVVRSGNVTHAVREAIGQLFTYQFFLYPNESPGLVALFSEPLGDAYVEFLQSHAVIVVWHDGRTWRGSGDAVDHQLADG